MIINSKDIPQVEFDKAVQRILAIGISRTPAESLVLSFWKLCQDLDIDFKKFLDNSIRDGQLDVEQPILDIINKNLPSTIRYRKDSVKTVSVLVAREL